MDSLELHGQQNAYPETLVKEDSSNNQREYNHDEQELKQINMTNFSLTHPIDLEKQSVKNPNIVSDLEYTHKDVSGSIDKSPAESVNEQVSDACRTQEKENQAIVLNDEEDDDAFVALCTDASSVLNNHDPIRRYHINKLYQPMNGQQENDTPLAEQDDEYLLYEELKFLETAAQELTDDRQRMQLTKILEDDDGDDDIDNLNSNEHGEDSLDRLHLTTIIEAFESFTSSPLIETCQGTDPLISQASCAIGASHEECGQDKPDSTGHGDSSSPASTDSGRGTSINNLIISYASSENRFDCERDDLQHGQQHLKRKNNQTPQYTNSITDRNNSLAIQQNQHNQSNHHKSHQAASSEINCLQSVSSTLMQMPMPKSVGDSPASAFTDNVESIQQNMQNQDDQQMNDAKTLTRKLSDEKRAKKRYFKPLISEDEAGNAPKITLKSRSKRRKVVATIISDDTDTQCSPQDTRVSSTMLGNVSPDTKSIYTSDEHQSGQFSAKTKRLEECIDHLGEDEDSEATSNWNNQHPQINKFKRRTANARERIRMREINQAFEKLKKVVPIELIQQATSGDESDQTSASSKRCGRSSASNNGSGDSIKLTKITTLRLAKSYIEKLTEILSQHPGTEGQDQRAPHNNESKISQLQVSNSKKSTNTRCKSTSRRKKNQKLPINPEKYTVSEEKSSQLSIQSISMADQEVNQPEKNYQVKDVSLNSAPRQGTSIVLNQGSQAQPFIITNALNNGQRSNTFIPIQQQPQQQFAYARCNQQPFTISHTSNSNSNNGHDRTFVTPVAVAILGIPAGSSNQGINDSQAIQLLGIQSSTQQMQLQHQMQNRQHTIQTNNPTYNLITQQNQPVTLTLNDISGLSVLRLGNHSGISGLSNQQAASIQLQQARGIVQQQPQFIATTTASGYNYTTYQPMQISQVQTANMTSLRQVANQQATFQVSQAAITNRTTTKQAICNKLSENRNDIVNHGNNLVMVTTQQPDTPTISTGTNNSDCRTIGISSNMISTQNLNTHKIMQQTQINIPQLNPSNIPHSTGQVVTLPAGTHLYQAQTASSLNVSPQTQNQTNLIYINPSSLQNNSFEPTKVSFQHQLVTHQQQVMNQSPPISSVEDTQGRTFENGSLATNSSFEQVKFVTQCAKNDQHLKQDKNLNEANIRQLVASIATSIQPASDKSSSGQVNDPKELSNQHQTQQHQQAQQPQTKRTYRFHNYDGNMITNHLYNTSHDKQLHSHQSQAVSKKSQQTTMNHVNSQRSRQNSLSSTCSTTSSSSSLLTGSSSASPNIPILSLNMSSIKSPLGIDSSHPVIGTNSSAPMLIEATRSD